MKLGILGYIPPKTFGHPQVFLDNLNNFPSKHQLVTYSDADWIGAIKLKASPEILKTAVDNQGKKNLFAVNNFIFLTGLRIAQSMNFTHIIYLEADCRVGEKAWDDKIFTEFFETRRPLIAAGSLACYNPSNYSAEAHRRWCELSAINIRKNFPIPTYGWVGAAIKHPSCVFPNGALSVLNIGWMAKLFNLEQSYDAARTSTAWDQQIGFEIWKLFEEDSYDVVAHLTSIFSSYGDVLTNEEERLEMVRSGKVCAIHQCKSDATV